MDFSKDPFDLTGRVALVTGASRGLGLAMAQGLAGKGATVVLNARSTEKLELHVKEIADVGGTADAIAFDVADAEAARRAVAEVRKRHGGLHILVNNAGAQHRVPLDEWTEEDWQRILDTNLTAAFRLCRLAAPAMLDNGWGRIINTGSVNVTLARPTIHAYIAAKAGLQGLTRSLAAELGPKGVTVNAIAPGYFGTELNTALTANKEFTAWVSSKVPVGRWGEPDEISAAAVFLASDAASFVNGHVLAVDGGMSATL